MANLQKTLLQKIFRPNMFKRIFEVRSQIQRLEEVYENSYIKIGPARPECLMKYNETHKSHGNIDEQAVYNQLGETELIWKMLKYRDALLQIAKEGDFDIGEVQHEVRMEKLKKLF